MTEPVGVGTLISILKVPKGVPVKPATTVTNTFAGASDAAIGPFRPMVASAFLRLAVSSDKVVPSGKPWPFSSAIQNQMLLKSGPPLPEDDEAPDDAALDEPCGVGLSFTLAVIKGNTPLR